MNSKIIGNKNWSVKGFFLELKYLASQADPHFYNFIQCPNYVNIPS